MPTINPVHSAEVRGAISRAATRTGVDFDYLLAQARLESGLDPSARAQTSSATGLYQFIDSTWLRTLDTHGGKHGMEWAENAILPGGHVSDAATRTELLSLRYDADTSSLMAAELPRENADGLRTFLGRQPKPTELYLAHFLGLGGAQKFLGALASDPGQSAAALMPHAAKANRSIFYVAGSPRSVAEVMTLMESKVATAYGKGDAPNGFDSLEGTFADLAGQAGIQNRHSPRKPAGTAVLPAAGSNVRPSMADTLRTTFGDKVVSADSAARHVSAAYNKLKVFGL